MTVHIGATGSRLGGSPLQLSQARLILAREWRPGIVFHHGKCRGADEQLHHIARELEYRMELHPPQNRAMESLDCDVTLLDTVHGRLPYRDRNQAIVDAVGRLIVIPEHPEDDPLSARSGTWMTKRMAERRGIPIDILPWSTP